jgi:hypothetical protein
MWTFVLCGGVSLFPTLAQRRYPPVSLISLSEWIKGRVRFSLAFPLTSNLSDAYVQHGTCPTCRHEFLPELRPVDSDAESSSDEEYVPTEYDADTDIDTDYEDGFMDSDGIDIEMEADQPHFVVDDEAMEGEEHESIASLRGHDGYHDSHDPEAQSVCDSEAAWWDGSIDGEREWGLTDGDSMATSEGELSFSGRFSGRFLVTG